MSNILSNLKPASGSVKNNKRVGRGQGSGRGGTSTRGHKGAKSRSGYSRKRNHEGGQTPLQMRVPKRGFKNVNRLAYVPFNVADLQRISEKYGLNTIDFDTLRKLRMIKKTDKIKVLAKGELTSALTISAHACSDAAKQAVEAAGGSISILSK